MTATATQTFSLDVALQQAVAHHQAGRLQEAERLYRAILQAQPNQPDANHNLGVLAVQAGQHAVGLPYLKAALEANPDQGHYALSYAGTLLATGQARKALNILRGAMQRGLNTPAAQALRKKAEAAALNEPAKGETPTSSEINQLIALFNAGRYAELESRAHLACEQYPDSGFIWKVLGVSLQVQGKDALPALQKASELLPDDAEAHNNLGVALKDLGQFDNAAASYAQALKVKPDYTEAHNNLGYVLQALGRLDDAVASYTQALKIKPDYAEAHNNLGNALQDLGRLDDAVASYRRALETKPGYAEAHNNLGNALRELGQVDGALASYAQALALKPDFAEAHNNLGSALADIGQFGDAVACGRRSLELKPDFAEAHSNLGITLQYLGQVDEAQASYRRMLAIKSSYAPGVSAPPVTALLPFGRSGSLFFHSLFDGHPEVATLPGVYFKGWFGMDQWKRFAPDSAKPDWREHLAGMILKEYQPLFDAHCKNNVAGKPLGPSGWLARDTGFTEMGADRSQPLVVDQDAFAAAFLSLLAPLSSVTQKDCFELIHRAFEIAIRGNTASAAQENGHIFYHIHNPEPFELAHFLQHYPHARLLNIIRNPVQNMESCMLGETEILNSAINAGADGKMETDFRISCWNRMIQKVAAMLIQMQSPFNGWAHSRGVRLEDVKRNARGVMPRIAAWMGIHDHPALYEASFCGLQYWGPASKATGKITGFDTKAIDQPVGRLLGPRDVIIFETIFWPLSHKYGYTELDAAGFRRQLAEIRPWLDKPLEFEMSLYAELPDHTRALEALPPYNRLHSLLRQFWGVLDRDGSYRGMTQPLELNGVDK